MAQVNPLKGMDKTLASIPEWWKSVTPHASNYLEGNESKHLVAIAFKTFDGGDVTYIDMYGNTRTQTLSAGMILPTTAVRVTAFTGTDLDAAFIGEPLV